jgi:hypothetical protein
MEVNVAHRLRFARQLRLVEVRDVVVAAVEDVVERALSWMLSVM